MAGNSASYPVYNIMNNYRLAEKHGQVALIILEIYWIEYFKILFLNIYNYMYKTLLQIQSRISISI